MTSMTDLMTTLATIALLDSSSMITVATVPMIMLLSSQRPVLTSASFIIGTVVTYFAMSVLVFMGLDSLIDAAGTWFARWMENPRTVCLYVQIAIGAVMLIIAIGMMQPSRKPPDRQPKSISPAGVFGFAAVLVVVGMPGAIPLFAAIDLLIRTDISDATAVTGLLFYNVIFVSPLVAMVVVRIVMGDRSIRVFEAIANFLSVWGKRIVIIVLLLLGMALIADGIGWLLGRSFIPID
jgi:cytochrome c biogenesis protein CcdA